MVNFKDWPDKTTPLTSEKLNQMQIDLIPNKFHLLINSDLDAGATITVPANYKVGEECLDVYYMGELLRKSSDEAGTDGHYQEVGESGSISNQIKITSDWSVETGEYFDFVIRGEYNA